MNKVNLLRTVLHCVQAFTFDKTTIQVSMQIWKNINSQKIKTLSRVKGLGNSITKTLKVVLEVAPTLVFWA